MVDIATIISATLMVIGGATVLLRIVAPLTKNTADDSIVKYLEKFLELVSLDSKAADGNVLKIKLK